MTTEKPRRMHFVCDCGDNSHMVQLEYYEPVEEWPFLTISVLLNHKMPWYRRLLRAMRYIFGRDTMRTWDDVLLTAYDAAELKGFLDGFINTELGKLLLEVNEPHGD